MKKIMNQPENIVNEMLEGLVTIHDDLVYRVPNTNVIARLAKTPNKVGLVSGGGSGHEPAHAGFVGDGMLSAAACGAVFTSPSPDQVLEAIKVADNGAGVLMIIKNYSGDIMNFDMAKELAELEDIKVDFIVVDDDIAVEDSTYTSGRRGVAGTVYVHKILGAAARSGLSLEEIKKIADDLVPNIKTLGLAIKAATVPEVGKPGFDLGDDEIEFGIGIHGEPGYRREKMKTSQEMAKELVDTLSRSISFEGNSFAILVNGMGATPLMEQYVFANDVLPLIEAKGATVAYKKLGDYMTAIDMAGISLTVLNITDPRYLEWLDESVTTIAWN
ncbi:dihydroxyacetone kinase subunit DhaK [Brochothrix thermosphacta]|uniref:Dihydroxyacetone kinase, N-terminal domain n=1 Tax=Brochothrix thermosphacta TaxID=2756 RepID=A0A2X0QPI5_BROTH|nr:dihydroxyacetone kinase subunit DhaK [Brochothrix thermosphacta]ANZ96258.1 dihydroxyacetone kinase subunit DhaK [Brochothrix thermosphacta]EUJ38832.1 dihydroxyacetone kinase subunit DhaK [Brochothrix thermosphacta DSM 20171 = FSL F6-1036]MDO7863844.1 dihydroxyacetone kinase subunit DhaK [Brochothrix thermosphacta]ODJ51191.1 dihydroxyacetone kinase subunit DhaK [Brochothrix thermosphacta DSM 20171 = FSL F6-1036]ODJ52178.1 dihydroxyacetone kinase subunit DhaK [Brochothrix thermosphacta]